MDQSRDERVEALAAALATAEEARNRLELLDRISQVVGDARLDVHGTFEAIVRTVSEALGDFCVLRIAPHAPGEESITFHHPDPESLALARHLTSKTPVTKREGFSARVFETGEPLLMAPIDHDRFIAATKTEYRPFFELHRTRSLAAVPIRTEGTIIGVLALLRERPTPELSQQDLQMLKPIADRAASAIVNARLYAEKKELFRRESEARRIRDELLSVVSHDLRNPLGVLVLTLDALTQTGVETTDPKLKNHLDRIRRATERMDNLVQILVDARTLERGVLILDLGPCNVLSLIMEAIEAHLPMANERSIVLTMGGEVATLDVLCDRLRVHQIFSNLLSNAFTFTPKGGSITLSARALEAAVELSVADTGPGIPPEDLPHIFDRYWKGKQRHNGLGLGLSIARQIVEAHGGHIRAETKVGIGTSFLFTLPLAKTQPINSVSS